MPPNENKSEARIKRDAKYALVEELLRHNSSLTACELEAICHEKNVSITRQHIGRILQRLKIPAKPMGRPSRLSKRAELARYFGRR
jgi:transposase